MIIIEWWQLGVIGVTVFACVLIAERISSHLDDRRQRACDDAHGPYQCNVHMGTEPDGVEWWCIRQDGHEGSHLTPWGLDEKELKSSHDDLYGIHDEELATTAIRALSDPEPFPMDQVIDAGGHIRDEEYADLTPEISDDVARSFTETQETTFEKLDLVRDPPEPVQCETRNLGGQGHRCLYPLDHTGEHHFGVWPTDQ